MRQSNEKKRGGSGKRCACGMRPLPVDQEHQTELGIVFVWFCYQFSYFMDIRPQHEYDENKQSMKPLFFFPRVKHDSLFRFRIR